MPPAPPETPRTETAGPSAVFPEAAPLTAFSFVPGWNLASIQNDPVDPNPAAVFSSIAGKFTRVFAYDACTPGDPWKLYDPANAAASDLTVVDQKIGFWIEMTAPAPVPNPGSLADETTIHLCPGWNLIGFPAEQARPVRTALASIEGKYARVFGHDQADTADSWEIYDVAVPAWANDLELMQPGRGYWVLATVETDLTISNVGAEPEVAITAPADLAEVTAPTDILGTIRSDRLQSWTLSYRAHGEAEAVIFASGNTPIVNGRLGTLDPTLLLNGGYTVELTATDFNGQSSTDEIDVSVEGQMKVGNFTLSFLDLEIPLSGLPIQVIRNYDSRDKRRGDFGVGWTLELKQGSYRNNRKPGDGWQFSSGFLPCQNIQETQGHTTTIRLSDQESYRFRLRLASPAPTLGGCFGQARFDFVDGPVPGATLAIVGNTEVIYQNGTNYVVDSSSFEIYEPQDVRLTTRDGRVFDLDLQQGVTRLQDLDGNILSILPGGITHSSGISVAFQRDGLGRITSIADPEGGSMTYSYDAAGDLVSMTDRETNTTRFTYAANHYLLEIEDPLGRKPVRNDYDSSGRLIRTTDAFGKAIELNHRLGNRQEIVTNRLGHSHVLEYDGRGNVIREVDANGKEKRRTFDADDRLLTETDPLGNTTTYTYDGNGDRTSVTDPEGNRRSFTYNSRGQVLTSLDAQGKLIKNTYNANGNLTQITDPLGNTVSLTYDSRGNVLTETDPEGHVTRSAYDASGNLIRRIDSLGHETIYTYDRNGNRLTETITRSTPAGTQTLTWSYSYDALGRRTRTTRPDGSVESVVYDPLDRAVETVSPSGARTLFTYDVRGLLTKTEFPDGTVDETGYDAEGRRTSFTDRGERTTRYEHDPLGRLIRTIHPDGAVETNTFDAATRLVATQDARGSSTLYEFDRAGRRTKITDALGRQVVFTFDPNSRQTVVTDAKGQRTSYEYDDTGRLTRTVHPDGSSRSLAYDKNGRRISETDPAGRTTLFGYDAMGRLISVTDAVGGVTSFAYDELGNRISQTDANGHITRFEYDAFSRPTKRTLPQGAAETLGYDAEGNLIRRTGFHGNAVDYAYDVQGRLTRRTYTDGSSVSFTYTSSGKRATAIDDRGTTTYQYDARDRLVRLTYPDGRALTYGYDFQGNRTSLKAMLGEVSLTTTYTYDVLNRLDTVTDPSGRTYSHTYDENGNRASVAYPNGVRTEYEYDSLNRLRSLATRNNIGSVIQSYLYELGPAGNRTRINEHDGTVRTYDYDAVYRLVRETAVGGPLPANENSFTYDAVGNRLTRTRTDSSGPTAISYTYDEGDRLLSENGITYGWNAAGNLISRSGPDAVVYDWDADDRMVRIAKADGTLVTQTYDADGNRIRVQVASPSGSQSLIEYLVDPAFALSSVASSSPLSEVIAESDGNGRLRGYYVHGDDLLAVLRPAGDRFFHADGLGSIRVLTDAGGTVTDRYSYEAFGSLLDHQGSDENLYLFAGETLDPNSGYYYLRARWMDPGTGRFLAMDPFQGMAQEPLTLHRYLYAGADPVGRTDPSGLMFGGLSEMNVAVAIQGYITTATNALNVAFRVLQTADTIRDILQYIELSRKILTAMAAASPGGAEAAILAVIQSVLGPGELATFSQSFEKAVKAIGSQWQSMGQRIAAHAGHIAAEATPEVFRRLPSYTKAELGGRAKFVIFTTTGPGGKEGDNYINVTHELQVAISTFGGRLFGLGVRTSKKNVDQIFRIDYWEFGKFDLHYHIYSSSPGTPIP
jgi:RHS repeat-associated protein